MESRFYFKGSFPLPFGLVEQVFHFDSVEDFKIAVANFSPYEAKLFKDNRLFLEYFSSEKETLLSCGLGLFSWIKIENQDVLVMNNKLVEKRECKYYPSSDLSFIEKTRRRSFRNLDEIVNQ